MSVLTPSTQQHVEENLVDDGLISKDELELLKSKATQNNQPFLTLLLEEGHISDEQLTKALAKANQVPYVNLSDARIDAKILAMLPLEIAEQYMAVPLGYDAAQKRLIVAMLDAGNVQAVDFLSNKVGQPVKVYAASESGIRHVMEQYDRTAGITSILNLPAELASAPESQASAFVPVGTAKKKVQVIVQDSPISKALSAILEYAQKNRASDIHIEPLEKELRIRTRVDGVLREVMKLPKTAEAPLVSRIKIMSNLKIDEHRIPQDGQFSVQLGGNEVDIRVAVSPVVWGEQVVLRLLEKDATTLNLEDMGWRGRALRLIRQGLKLPHGMILTSGPTGSGKTTSMYAMISEIKKADINIVTLEDPVEYKITGVNQIQVNPEVGLTFATGLRSILRQDPDVVMVGEIRDRETAGLAVQAALTGHLVFSTLHTNSAAGILPRLLDMGIEPFLIASTVHTVIGQRLVRRVIEGGERYKTNAAETAAIKQTLDNLLPKTAADMPKVAQDLGYESLPAATENAYTLVKPNATLDNPTGYRGRMGLYEVFEVSEAIQELIVKHPTSSMIQKMAQAQGMVTMKQDGYLKALAGLTTLTEVDRVASADS